MTSHALEGGFRQPAIDAAHAFRAVMDSMARPGVINTVVGAKPPAPLSVAAGVCLLTLCDHETPVYLTKSHDVAQVREWVAFHTGAPITSADSCLYAVGTWATIQPLSQYPQGTPEYPDRSATLLVEMEKLNADGARLSGPGIKDTASLSLPDVLPFRVNHKQYPLGLDFIFTTADQIAALPRSTEVSG